MPAQMICPGKVIINKGSIKKTTNNSVTLLGLNKFPAEIFIWYKPLKIQLCFNILWPSVTLIIHYMLVTFAKLRRGVATALGY